MRIGNVIDPIHDLEVCVRLIQKMAVTCGILLALAAASLAATPTPPTSTPPTSTPLTTLPTTTSTSPTMPTTLSMSSPTTPTPTMFHHLILVGIATLVTCVCVLVVVAVVYVVVSMWRPRPSVPAEFVALTPVGVEPVEHRMPAMALNPGNNGYEIPFPNMEVDRLPMAPLCPLRPPPEYLKILQEVVEADTTGSNLTLRFTSGAPRVRDSKQPSTSSQHYETSRGGEAAVAVHSPHKSLLREFSSRELPPIPKTVSVYEPVGEPCPATPSDDRNSFSELAVERMATSRSTAPPVRKRPDWSIQ